MGADATAALNRALWKGDRKAVAKWLPRVDPDHADRWGRTPLAMAATYGSVDEVRALARGADPDGGRTGLTPLALATARGEADVNAALRKAGAAKTPFVAAYAGDTRALTRVDPALVDEKGTPLLLHAAQSGHVAVARALLHRGADVHAAGASAAAGRRTCASPGCDFSAGRPTRGRR